MIRVRQALADTDLVRKLRGKLPKAALEPPECPKKPSYPSALLKALDGEYSLLGIVAELLLQNLSIAASEAQLKLACLRVGVDLPEKVFTVASTSKFLASVNATKEKLREIVGNETCIYDAAVEQPGCAIHGHPDVLTETQIFEVKTTGRLKQGWVSFLLQAFAYAALRPSSKTLHIVLPLSEHVWTWDLCEWPKRAQFLKELQSYSQPQPLDADFVQDIFGKFPIGFHVAKEKRLSTTLQRQPYPERPCQIFFTKSTKFSVSDEDMAESLQYVEANHMRVFVHAPYLLNLCAEPDADEYMVRCLQKHLACAHGIGAKGVVVHVGKACDRGTSLAIENMRTNLSKAIESAHPDCPLLLETPAGQGTEVLTNPEEFIRFVASFADPRLGMCLDTCHTHAAGTAPLAYLTQVLESSDRDILKLVHFNDSKADFGTRKDRHAMLGGGTIGKEALVACATLVHSHGVAMLFE